MRSQTWLYERKGDVHSQCGEDGVIAAALSVLEHRDYWCVEFGAWDGLHLSNTRNLVEQEGYRSVLIEGDRRRFEILKKNCAERVGHYLINSFVGFRESDNLDTILSATPIPEDFDFLSIDIDGNDYHVWRASHRYKPKLVCIEFNPTIATECEFVQPASPKIHQGCGLLPLVTLGKEKGYELICVLPWNAFFIRTDLFGRFGISDNRPETLRLDKELVSYLFSGFDGTVLTSGSCYNPWHKFSIRVPQVLPSFMRVHFDGVSLIYKIARKVLGLLGLTR